MPTADVLFVHNNFPGQFGFIATALKQRGMRCVAIGSKTAKSKEIPVRHWSLPRGSAKDIFPIATRAEADLLRARAAADVAVQLREQGFSPSLIIGHPGWGETLLLPEVFPKARLILHGEFYYRAEGGDVGFDPEFQPLTQEERYQVAAKNAGLALAYMEADRIVSPTTFQASFFPSVLKPRMNIVHEGVETDTIRRRKNVKLRIPNGPTLDQATPVVTFVNRTFEPLRGYHVFMRALPAFLAARPDAHVVLVGGETGRGYGATFEGGTWKDKFLDEVRPNLDLSRVHFVGRTPHDWLLDALSLSTAHVYYTYPFVLSWSLLEAMACECYVIASNTGPVRDAITDGVNGTLLDFFDIPALSQALVDACENPARFADRRTAARQTVLDHFDRAKTCLPAWLGVIDDVLKEGPR